AIKNLAVRGAPAIGIAGAFGFVLAAMAVHAQTGNEVLQQISAQIDRLANSRPTAVNLRWAIERMKHRLASAGSDWQAVIEKEAIAIQAEDLAANHAMGLLGIQYLPDSNARVLTHCNTGSLATAGFGTALGVIRAGVATGKISQVYASETRPWLQGSRLTIWELLEDGIEASLIVDSASAYLMQQGQVDFVIVGADRICANGDVANKIGTFAHALAAKAHGVKVMVVASSSTIDMETATGSEIEIEQRESTELTHVGSIAVGANAAHVFNPVFDITPAKYIDFIVTEKGVVEHPNAVKMQALIQAGE
ncbi:MAG: S-methyl-5-thioribose-1-phosphate isomerase, partial [Arenimonas sp.]|nr:S-methyl-5-thioribose-1-phosphate isomerase [Arenimonas sp.]